MAHFMDNAGLSRAQEQIRPVRKHVIQQAQLGITPDLSAIIHMDEAHPAFQQVRFGKISMLMPAQPCIMLPGHALNNN